MSYSGEKSSLEEVLNRALELSGKSLIQACANIPENVLDKNNKGNIGSLVEKYFFEITPDNNGPDFPNLGLELKVTGLKANKNRLSPVAKERLVLTMIDYKKIVVEDWAHSAFIKKCNLMLILTYFYEENVDELHRKFSEFPILCQLQATADTERMRQIQTLKLNLIPAADLAQIRRDWEYIQAKIKAGEAHQLSEGDTYYLAACRKGSGGIGERLREQPNSPIKAKSRAFSFKPSYLNLLIDQAARNAVNETSNSDGDFEILIRRQFAPYLGKSDLEISKALNFKLVSRPKNFHRMLINKILNSNTNLVNNLKKSGIEVKTVKLNRRGNPKESMSFPAFDFYNLLSEEWEDSIFFEKLESKFLFVVFKANAAGDFIFSNAGYWNMPYADRKEAERVWLETKFRVSTGLRPLPQSGESSVAHVRPHGRNSKDVLPLPTGGFEARKSFWLNRKYIKSVIEGLVEL